MIEPADLQLRQHYHIRCSACGRAEVVLAIVPDEVWARIARGAYSLCPVCMDERLEEIGERVEPYLHFMGRGMFTRPPEWASKIMGGFMPPWDR